MLVRDDIFQEFVLDQAEHLVRTKNINKADAIEFVKKICKERYKAPKIKAIVTERPGYEVTKDISFKEFMTAAKTNIVCPNGRIYVSPQIKPARIREYIKDLLKRRSFHKKKMFGYQQKLEYELAAMEKANESRIKIDANTTCGGAKNSPYSCFYDKAGFNAVTAVARLMIKTNYSILEQVIGGNYYWADEDELVNNIILRVRNCPTAEAIENIVTKYDLYRPTKNDLMERFQFFMNLYEIGPSYLFKTELETFRDNCNIDSSYTNQYLADAFDKKAIKNLVGLSPIYKDTDKIVDLTNVKNLVDSLTEHEVIFIYYVNNLRALFWKNSKVFKPKLKDMIDNNKNLLTGDFNPEDLFTLDGELLPIVSTHFADIVKGEELAELIKKDPAAGKEFVRYLFYLNSLIGDLDDLLEIFFKTNIGITRTRIKDQMWRNTTLGSDTDSVIYTLKEWVKWFSGDYFDNSPEIDSMLAVIAYFISKIAVHNNYLLSIHLGARGDDTTILKMKGEYDFNSMVFYFIKKHYTGVMTIQEGRVLSKIKLDIKGIGLRNSAVPFIIAEKMKEYTIQTQNRKSASYYIKDVTSIEKEMAIDLRRGSHQFLKSISVKNKETYANAESSAYLYLLFWNEVFSAKYGEVKTPVKCPCVFLLPPEQEVLKNIKTIDPIIYNKLKNFLDRYPKRKMNNIIINPLMKFIPEEILAMMNMRKHIYTNMRPLYLTLESFGMPFMHNHKKQLLVSDYYNEFDLQLLTTDEEGIEE